MLGCRCGGKVYVLLVLCIGPLACLLPSPCPPGCCCPGFLVLCESLGLRSLPRSVPLSTAALSVARNQLCNVDHLLRLFSGLQELSLSHNLLPRFPRGLPPSLESLLLQENRITFITSGALRQLGNLTRLDLEDNRISAIQPGALLGLPRLQVLILKGNKLTSLPLNLPPSVTHLDVSANCISVLDLPSLSALVNLQVLKINSNCLRSVPESAFDGLPRLRSVDLTNNLWLCECDILYLYRWLLRGRVRMATDLVCSEPVHLAHRLLLDLSVMAICPRVLKPNERTQQLDLSSALETVKPNERTQQLDLSSALETVKPNERTQQLDLSSALETVKPNERTQQLDLSSALETVKPMGPSPSKPKQYLGIVSELISQETTDGLLSEDGHKTRVSLDHYSLETLTYEECLSLNKTQPSSSPDLKNTSVPAEEQKCRDNITSGSPHVNTTPAEGTRSLLSTNRDAPRPTLDPRPLTQHDSVLVVSLLAVLCVLVALLMLVVLLALKKVLLRHQQVAPLNVGSGG
ncbi:Slit like 2 protein [Dissostichus eleginoides]|uniref:Slit like 2 protein n=1 Tax=Dissostichus eleginoides TaxID=100907 RepID=A0AAD9F4U9_DISEL|nr:Slit like 2 protein [Dissostichus eleginoides]